MKTLFLILFLAPLFGLSQTSYNWNEPFMNTGTGNEPKHNTIFYFWNQYISDCNQLVSDTVKQNGTVNVKYKPVIVNGEISHYILSPIDTVWNKVECNDYKYDYYQGSLISSGSLYYVNNATNYASTGISYTKIEQVNNKINITRNKVCKIKKRKASFEDFWNRWLVEQKIIELN